MTEINNCRYGNNQDTCINTEWPFPTGDFLINALIMEYTNPFCLPESTERFIVMKELIEKSHNSEYISITRNDKWDLHREQNNVCPFIE